ncbi:MAG: geranylgeranylglycerol-phosphate geranylgeranyltransferase [Methanomicrobiales archaeon]|nr:geranylgeranylglycerol-phosphate geranylgeranyltransferase [Methanomicrobiales archaeon]
MKIPGILRIMRPANAVIAGFAAILGYFIASGTLVPGVLLIWAAVVLVTAGGNTINDYFDAGIDRINRPDRPIPSGEVREREAWNLSFVLFAAGILMTAFTNILCVVIAIFNSLLLFLYAARLKRSCLFGNLAVSYLSASIFLFGGAYLGWEGAIRVLPIALITFFAMVSRELLKDAEDVEGDRPAGAETVPVRYGVKAAVILSLVCAVGAVAGSIYPVSWWGIWYLAGILPVDAIIIVAAIRPLPCRDPQCIKTSRATGLLKTGMFASLVVFFVAALLA